MPIFTFHMQCNSYASLSHVLIVLCSLAHIVHHSMSNMRGFARRRGRTIYIHIYSERSVLSRSSSLLLLLFSNLSFEFDGFLCACVCVSGVVIAFLFLYVEYHHIVTIVITGVSDQRVEVYIAIVSFACIPFTFTYVQTLTMFSVNVVHFCPLTHLLTVLLRFIRLFHSFPPFHSIPTVYSHFLSQKSSLRRMEMCASEQWLNCNEKLYTFRIHYTKKLVYMWVICVVIWHIASIHTPNPPLLCLSIHSTRSRHISVYVCVYARVFVSTFADKR